MQSSNTRLIVKNVPKHVDERRLRQHFAEKGVVSKSYRFECGTVHFRMQKRL